MSIRRGNSVIASSGSNGPQMFDMKWSDHIINDLNWISSHSNSYHSGNTYKKMYNHLVEDYHNGVDETEVIDSYTISYKLAPDGHKIVDTVSSGVVDNIYDSTGIAWYYVLDTTNQQFKLPRTKYGFVGLRDTVGKYVPESLPNITGSIESNNWAGTASSSSALYPSGSGQNSLADGWGVNTINIDASRSSSAYQDNAPVQQRATQMLLYFYTEQFSVNGSSSGGNADYVVEWQTPTTENNYTWYRLYKSGWIEQGFTIQVTSDSAGQSVSLPITMADTNYSVQATCASLATQWTGESMIRVPKESKTTTSFTYQGGQTDSNGYCYFEVKGFAAQS